MLRDRQLEQRIGDERDETDRAIDNAIEKAQGRFFGTRMLGFALGLAGAALPAWANLV